MVHKTQYLGIMDLRVLVVQRVASSLVFSQTASSPSFYMLALSLTDAAAIVSP